MRLGHPWESDSCGLPTSNWVNRTGAPLTRAGISISAIGLPDT